MTQILKNSWVKNDGEGPLPRIDNLQLSSKAAIPLIQYHHRIIWFTHRENSSFNIIQNFCKGNTKHAGILLSHCPWIPSRYGVKRLHTTPTPTCHYVARNGGRAAILVPLTLEKVPVTKNLNKNPVWWWGGEDFMCFICFLWQNCENSLESKFFPQSVTISSESPQCDNCLSSRAMVSVAVWSLILSDLIRSL